MTAPARPGRETPAGTLVGTLAVAGAMAGLLIVSVYRTTQPAIRAHKAEVLQQGIEEVLKGPARFDTLYVSDGSLSAELPGGVDPGKVEQIYLGYDAAGTRVGFAITAAQPGFQDVIRLLFGYDAERRTLLGMKVLESKETPGLGDKIEKDEAFVGQFDGATPPLIGVKARGAPSVDPSQVDMITGATISSRTVIGIINNTLERLGPALASYEERP